MKNHFSFLLILFLSWTVNAETIYVTDDLELTLRSGPSQKNKIIEMLSSGTPLAVLKREPSGYIRVQTPKGSEGYILSRHTKKNHTNSWYLKIATEKLQHLRNENKQMKAELTTLKSEHNNEVPDNPILDEQKDPISQKPAELQQTAADTLQLKHHRNQLQERVVNAERELQQLKREKQTLEDSTDQTWFIYGGLLAFAGIFLGLLIPKMSWRRRSSRWDTF